MVNIQKENVLATYIHGCFDDGLDDKLIDMLFRLKGLDRETADKKSFYEYRQEQYDILADVVRDSLDMDMIYKVLGL